MGLWLLGEMRGSLLSCCVESWFLVCFCLLLFFFAPHLVYLCTFWRLVMRAQSLMKSQILRFSMNMEWLSGVSLSSVVSLWSLISFCWRSGRKGWLLCVREFMKTCPDRHWLALLAICVTKCCVIFTGTDSRCFALCRRFGEYDMFLLEIRSSSTASFCWRSGREV